MKAEKKEMFYSE